MSYAHALPANAVPGENTKPADKPGLNERNVFWLSLIREIVTAILALGTIIAGLIIVYLAFTHIGEETEFKKRKRHPSVHQSPPRRGDRVLLQQDGHRESRRSGRGSGGFCDATNDRCECRQSAIGFGP